jgi:hypothetical protein
MDLRKPSTLARISMSTFPFSVPVSSAPTGTSRATTSATETSGGGAFASCFPPQAAASAAAARAAARRAKRGAGRGGEWWIPSGMALSLCKRLDQWPPLRPLFGPTPGTS